MPNKPPGETRETFVKIFIEEKDGMQWSNYGEFSIDELGGTVPQIGDTIVDPGVPDGLPRQNPENRDFYEVRKRYFSPLEGQQYIALVVEKRPGRDGECAFNN